VDAVLRGVLKDRATKGNYSQATLIKLDHLLEEMETVPGRQQGENCFKLVFLGGAGLSCWEGWGKRNSKAQKTKKPREVNAKKITPHFTDRGGREQTPKEGRKGKDLY